MSPTTSIDRFVEAQLRLLELERRAEIDEARRLLQELSAVELERRGVALLRLRVAEEDIGLGGRRLLRMERVGGGDLPPHRIGPGDVVSARSERGSSKRDDDVTGVVWRTRQDRVTIALEDSDADLREPIRLDRVSNDVTFRRLRDAMLRLRAYEKGPARRLREVLFGERDPRFEKKLQAPAALTFLDDALDPSQREAVAFAASATDVALIHGPPGTGKTTAVVEVIRQAVQLDHRVIACAPSNVAVDNLVERLARAGVRVVRLGHPARLLPSVLDHSLDALIAQSEGAKIAEMMRREIRDAARDVKRARDRSERRERRDELRRLRSDLREIENQTVRQIVGSAEVVLTTLTAAADQLVSTREFDLAVIDEASQAIEASCWIPMLQCRRVVLAGDHLQLPPTIISREAAKQGLAKTLFERLTKAHGDVVTRMLSVQYRMHESIMNWSSEALYDGRIEAHASVKEHRLCDLDGVEETDDTRHPLVLIDTAGCDLEEAQEASGDSRSNEGEAKLVAKHVEALVEAGVSPADIAVITPYNAQVGLLRSRLRGAFDGLEIGSVDGFQGREKEAIVLSLVRSNARGEVGFLSDERRLNVAVTRARRHVAIIGDSATVSSHPFLAQLVEYFLAKGDYRSAWETL